MAADRSDPVEPAVALGRALRDLQRRSGRTLRALEESVRISDSSLSRYFCGSTVPPWSAVHDLCRALDGDPAEFRHLWEAADRGQRRPGQDGDRAGQRTRCRHLPRPAVAPRRPAPQRTRLGDSPRSARGVPPGRWSEPSSGSYSAPEARSSYGRTLRRSATTCRPLTTARPPPPAKTTGSS
ncbi:helix-turn-helix domain-containing protein [Streptomyces sp. SID6041]|nr:helix-turn-helix domain-containing protein [Streptomyces sp. SID6041]